ncbi:MAG: class I SAM-dependent RNA methyltransferase [Mycoplasmatales bacterium]|nr:class I SAM-dependent RNA methyltransferase [Mycoplasmatales bacterium]
MGNRRRNKKRYPRRYCPLETFVGGKLNKKGQGTIEYNGKIFNVDELLPGEEAFVVIFYEDKFGGEARAQKLVKKSPDRSLPLNHPKMQLGSYQIPHMTDQAQDKWKQSRVNETFNFEANFIKVGKRKNYRNKVVLKNGGFRPPGRGRKFTIIPQENQFDLMEINFDKYKDTQGDLIIRRLDTEIVGKPGENKFTTHSVLGKKFYVGLNSFYQVNNEMSEIAYKDIIEEIKENDIVYDLFGGAATIGIHVANKAKMVYSVELNKESHEDAKKNIEINNAHNVEAILGDANLWVINNQKNADVIILDPSRAGLSEESVKAINDSGVEKIIYLSCNIDSQKRDIDGFTNYHIDKMQPYDFFPQTYHIENLIILKINNVRSKNV